MAVAAVVALHLFQLQVLQILLPLVDPVEEVAEPVALQILVVVGAVAQFFSLSAPLAVQTQCPQ